MKLYLYFRIKLQGNMVVTMTMTTVHRAPLQEISRAYESYLGPIASYYWNS
jgi:hypothetical protein